jgi:hypothetical protein
MTEYFTTQRNVRDKNMVMSPSGLGKKKDCAGEDQHQSLLPHYRLYIDFDDRSGTSSLNFER